MLREPTKRNGRRAFLIAGSGKPRRGHEKARQPGSTSGRGRNQARTTRKDREEVEVLRGSLHGVARVLQAAQLRLRLHGVGQQVILEPASLSQKITNAPINFAPRARPLRPQKLRPGRCARGPRAGKRPCPNLDSSSATDLETRGKYRELKRKLSERALTQRKARAREEPSPRPPASETDARPPGHQPRGGTPARPRLSRGQEGPT